MNEVSIIINGVRYDAVEMTREENDMAVSCNLCDLQYECKNAPIDLEMAEDKLFPTKEKLLKSLR